MRLLLKVVCFASPRYNYVMFAVSTKHACLRPPASPRWSEVEIPAVRATTDLRVWVPYHGPAGCYPIS